MGCLYEDRMEGYCTLTLNDDGEFTFDCEDLQGSEDGYCVCSDDPYPSYICDSYESDWTCPDCGVDLNVEECNCENE